MRIPPLLRFAAFCFLLAVTPNVAAQETQSNALPEKLTLNDAVELALKNYPAIRAASAQADAAGANVALARTALLPRVDLLWQQNRATRNNVFGLLLPQSVLPGISGPELASPNQDSAWGNAAGFLFNWEPFDFGQRKAQIEIANRQQHQAQSAIAVTQLDVATAAADSFLAVIAADQAVKLAQLTVARMEALAKVVHTLVDNELRAGIEASRADAEVATARNQLIQAEQNALITRATLAEALGVADSALTFHFHPDIGKLLTLPLSENSTAQNFKLHPQLLAQQAAIDTARARQQSLERAWVPRFNFLASVYGRGSGAFVDGRVDNSRGFYPNTANWAIGVNVTFPLLDFVGLRARRKFEASSFTAEQARYEQTALTLKAQDTRTRAMIDAARRIAANTPVQLKAAQETELRARVRYENGLTNLIEVTEAQRLLARAEMEDALARLNVWRAKLVAARVSGDLKPFLEQVK